MKDYEIGRKQLTKAVVDKLWKNGERIIVGGGKYTYIIKYVLKYGQTIVNKVISAFLDVIVDFLAQGKTVKIAGYFIISPVFVDERKLYDVKSKKYLIIPAHFHASVKCGTRIKNACKSVNVDNKNKDVCG